MSFTFDAVVNSLMRDYSVDRERAEELARKALGGDGRAAVAVPVVDEGALEKVHEHAGDKLMQSVGFEVVRFSHPGKTKQTPGIADRRYYHRRRRLALWWEVKSATGVQSPDQREFEAMVTACGDVYLCGTEAVLVQWLADERIAVMVNGTLELVNCDNPDGRDAAPSVTLTRHPR